MKKSLITMALLGFSSIALAGGVDTATVTAGTTYSICDGGASGGAARVWGGSGTVLTDPTAAVFTRVGFNVQCSANSFVSAQEVSTNLAVVAAGSGKGNQSFGGSSNGGAIGASAKCTGTNDACTADDIDTAIAKAITDSSS